MMMALRLVTGRPGPPPQIVCNPIAASRVGLNSQLALTLAAVTVVSSG